MSVELQKAELRKSLRQKVSNVTASEQQALQHQVKNWLMFQSGTWGAFNPLPGEPDLRPLVAEMSHLTWVYPRMNGDHLELHGPVTEWVTGTYGVQEPAPGTPQVEINKLTGILIPGLGFDRKNRRLGRGKGFYDRLLQNWTGLRVGVCFDAQRVDEVPVEEHDCPVDVVVTETGTFLAE